MSKATKTLPTEAGPYIWQARRKGRAVRVDVERYEGRMVGCYHGGRVRVREMGGWWSGPIPEPPLPNQPKEGE